MDGLTWFAVVVGVTITWCLNLHERDNPAAIPIGNVLVRALPGVALYVVLGTIFSAIVLLSVLLRIPGVEQNSTLRLLTALIAGFVVPQAARLKDRVLTRTVARKYPFVASCIQWIDESSRIYCRKIINREERKLSFELLKQDGDVRQSAIHRLFEFHLIEIAHHECARLKKEHDVLEPVLNVFNVRNVQVKLKFFTRFLGYRVALDHICQVAANPLVIFPTWPPAPDDRRATSANGRGRRKYEQPYVKAYVLGHF